MARCVEAFLQQGGSNSCLGTYHHMCMGDVLQVRIDGLYRQHNVSVVK